VGEGVGFFPTESERRSGRSCSGARRVHLGSFGWDDK
jgi:hypothetical protein